MDTLRGNFDSSDVSDDSYDYAEDDTGREMPPAAIGQDERRMQVRAYNHWAGKLGERNFPSIEDLDPTNLPDFGPYSVLLDFSAGIDDPAIQYLGDLLAAECDAQDEIARLSDVPSRSLLSRITDHYMQILANQAPIGFEAEFVNQRGSTILYRGILLPYSSDDETIDFIYGVINWKEMADQVTTDELLLEIDQALDAGSEPQARRADALTDWADGPASVAAAYDAGDDPEADDGHATDEAMPLPAFGNYSAEDEDGYEDDYDDEDEESGAAHYSFASLTDHVATPAVPYSGDDEDDADAIAPVAPLEPAAHRPARQPIDLSAYELAEPDSDTDADADTETDVAYAPVGADSDGLYDCLASARELAQAARSSEDRSRSALYAAVGRAYDFSLAADEAPEEYNELVAESGLTVQDRAPMTPVVKLVFGADYDKTRLTEYAAVLSHAHRVGIERGKLAGFLAQAEGGLKGVVTAERRLRREESGKPVEPANEPREALARKLREIAPQSFDALSADGAEFALVMIRRTPEGDVVMLGEIAEDIALIERAARKLVA